MSDDIMKNLFPEVKQEEETTEELVEDTPTPNVDESLDDEEDESDESDEDLEDDEIEDVPGNRGIAGRG